MKDDGQLQVGDYRDGARIGGSWMPLVGAGGVALVLLGMFGVGWRSWFGTAHEQVRREIFEESQAHVRGVNVDLSRLRREWTDAEPGDPMRRALQALERIEFVSVAPPTRGGE